MLSVNMHEAKTHLSRLVEGATHGKPFIIAKAGKPMVKVIPFLPEEEIAERRLGFMNGEICVPDDFDQIDSDRIAALFEGKEA